MVVRIYVLVYCSNINVKLYGRWSVDMFWLEYSYKVMFVLINYLKIMELLIGRIKCVRLLVLLI